LRNSIVKNLENFFAHDPINFAWKFLTVTKKLLKEKMKWLFTVMTSVTMFTPKQNPYNFVVNQKSKQISVQICLTECQNPHNFVIG